MQKRVNLFSFRRNLVPINRVELSNYTEESISPPRFVKSSLKPPTWGEGKAYLNREQLLPDQSTWSVAKVINYEYSLSFINLVVKNKGGGRRPY